MFIFQKVVSGKPLFKLSCVFLPLEKVVNGKHFPVNEKHFPVKGKFDLVSRKVFSLLVVFVFRFQTFMCLFAIRKVNGKHFPIKGKFGLVFRKVFS